MYLIQYLFILTMFSIKLSIFTSTPTNLFLIIECVSQHFAIIFSYHILQYMYVSCGWTWTF